MHEPYIASSRSTTLPIRRAMATPEYLTEEEGGYYCDAEADVSGNEDEEEVVAPPTQEDLDFIDDDGSGYASPPATTGYDTPAPSPRKRRRRRRVSSSDSGMDRASDEEGFEKDHYARYHLRTDSRGEDGKYYCVVQECAWGPVKTAKALSAHLRKKHGFHKVWNDTAWNFQINNSFRRRKKEAEDGTVVDAGVYLESEVVVKPYQMHALSGLVQDLKKDITELLDQRMQKWPWNKPKTSKRKKLE